MAKQTSGVSQAEIAALIAKISNGQLTPEGVAALNAMKTKLAPVIELKVDENGKVTVNGLRKQPFGMQKDEWRTFLQWQKDNAGVVEKFLDESDAHDAEVAAKKAAGTATA